MDADLIEIEQVVHQAHIPVRGPARTDVTEDRAALSCQVLCAQRRDRTRPDIGDCACVHDGDRRPGLRVHQVEDAQLGGQVFLVVVHEIAHHFDPRQPERLDHPSQHIEVPVSRILGHKVHARLDDDLAIALCPQGGLDSREDLVLGQRQRLDVGAVDVGDVNLPQLDTSGLVFECRLSDGPRATP